MMTISLLIDAIILIALVGAVTYGVILSRRIARLQSALIELAPVLQAFCDAVDQSERSVEEIRREADRLERGKTLVATRGPDLPRTTKAKPDRGDLVKMFFETARTRTN